MIGAVEYLCFVRMEIDGMEFTEIHTVWGIVKRSTDSLTQVLSSGYYLYYPIYFADSKDIVIAFSSNKSHCVFIPIRGTVQSGPWKLNQWRSAGYGGVTQPVSGFRCDVELFDVRLSYTIQENYIINPAHSCSPSHDPGNLQAWK